MCQKFEALLRCDATDAHQYDLAIGRKFLAVVFIASRGVKQYSVDASTQLDKAISRRACFFEVLADAFGRVKDGVNTAVAEQKALNYFKKPYRITAEEVRKYNLTVS